MKILVVEDETALATGLKFNFEQEGYDVIIARDGRTALKQFEHPDHAIDLVVLDLMLPDLSGYETCREIRRLDQRVPVLVLSARTLSEDKAIAFDCGTDQYMTKPFALPELLSRIRNLIQRHPRSRAEPVPNPNPLPAQPELNEYRFGDVLVDFKRYKVTRAGSSHDPTTIEMQLLRYFIEHADRVLSRQEILENVWKEPGDISTRSIDNFVLRLRKIIEPNPSQPRHLLSVRGTGYRFVPDPGEGEAEE